MQSTTAYGGGGGGYGGYGGDDSLAAPHGGPTYGMTNAPMHPGSGSGPRNSYHQAADGGGYIRIVATNAVTVDGTITVDGDSHSSYGGASGGGIWIDCAAFSGASSGRLLANGGNGGATYAGGGGGGRIAVWYGNLADTARSLILSNRADEVALLSITNVYGGFQGQAEAEPGTGDNDGDAGTVVFLTVEGAGPKIYNRVATNVQSASAHLNGDLSFTGAAPATVSVYWGDDDKGDTTVGWDSTEVFPGNPLQGDVTTNVTVIPNTVYYYRYYADNGGGTFLAPTTSVFSTWPVTIAATAPNADEDGQVPGTITVSRASVSTNYEIDVYYTIGGTAGNGTDYNAIGTNVTLAVGETNATIEIKPITDPDTGEPAETVVLTLYGDKYVVGAMNTATVTIANVAVLSSSNNWVGGTGNWSDPTQWSEGYVPVAGQDVVVTGGVLLASSTDPLASLRITNGTLTASNWMTKIEATDLWVDDGGAIGLPVAFTNGAVSNRIWVVCSNLTVASGGHVDADEGGFSGGLKTALTQYNGQGPGAGRNSSTAGGGGGHGGKGGQWTYPGAASQWGWAYGSASAPETPGSGGGADDGTVTEPGGHGGGAIRVQASGLVTVHGTVSADGGGFPGGDHRGGFGSGGSIHITCDTFAGTNGLVQAEGGRHQANWGGGGGGGRISVVYDTVAQAAMPRPRVVFNALGGWDTLGNYTYRAGHHGTVYFANTDVLDPAWLPHGGVVHFAPAIVSWAPGSLLASNGWLRIGQTNMALTVTGDIVVTGPGTHLETAEGGAVTCGGNLVVSNNAEMTIHAGPTNGAPYGAEVTVAGDIVVASGATLYSSSEPRNGGSPFFTAQNLRVDAGGLMSADQTGWRGGWYGATGYGASGYGPGGGLNSLTDGPGGGYGGEGGASTIQPGGQTYGDSNAPAYPGSGGASRNYSGYEGGSGGGLIRVEAVRAITLDGTISADGQSNSWGGGSGGGIYLRCLRFQGAATGILSADGGSASGNNGGGGGGRIAIWRFPPWHFYSGSHTEAGGSGYDSGDVGTYTLNEVKLPQGTLFMVR